MKIACEQHLMFLIIFLIVSTKALISWRCDFQLGIDDCFQSYNQTDRYSAALMRCPDSNSKCIRFFEQSTYGDLFSIFYLEKPNDQTFLEFSYYIDSDECSQTGLTIGYQSRKNDQISIVGQASSFDVVDSTQIICSKPRTWMTVRIPLKQIDKQFTLVLWDSSQCKISLQTYYLTNLTVSDQQNPDNCNLSLSLSQCIKCEKSYFLQNGACISNECQLIGQPAYDRQTEQSKFKFYLQKPQCYSIEVLVNSRAINLNQTEMLTIFEFDGKQICELITSAHQSECLIQINFYNQKRSMMIKSVQRTIKIQKPNLLLFRKIPNDLNFKAISGQGVNIELLVDLKGDYGSTFSMFMQGNGTTAELSNTGYNINWLTNRVKVWGELPYAANGTTLTVLEKNDQDEIIYGTAFEVVVNLIGQTPKGDYVLHTFVGGLLGFVILVILGMICMNQKSKSMKVDPLYYRNIQACGGQNTGINFNKRYPDRNREQIRDFDEQTLRFSRDGFPNDLSQALVSGPQQNQPSVQKIVFVDNISYTIICLDTHYFWQRQHAKNYLNSTTFINNVDKHKLIPIPDDVILPDPNEQGFEYVLFKNPNIYYKTMKQKLSQTTPSLLKQTYWSHIREFVARMQRFDVTNLKIGTLSQNQSGLIMFWPSIGPVKSTKGFIKRSLEWFLSEALHGSVIRDTELKNLILLMLNKQSGNLQLVGNFYASHNNISLENFIVDQYGNLVQIVGWEFAAVLPPTFEIYKLRMIANEFQDMNCNCDEADLMVSGINQDRPVLQQWYYVLQKINSLFDWRNPSMIRFTMDQVKSSIRQLLEI